MKKLLAVTGIPVLAIFLAGCSVQAIPFLDISEDGTTLGAGESETIHFFTTVPNLNTGIALQAGSRYTLDVMLLNNWIDSTIEKNEHGQNIDEFGFSDDRMLDKMHNAGIPFALVKMSKRSNEHHWFELMLYQPKCKSSSLQGISDLTKDEASGSYNFVAACDGNLTLFVNDTPGFYSNNVGYANLALSRVN